jgi:hypothetical protein
MLDTVTVAYYMTDVCDSTTQCRMPHAAWRHSMVNDGDCIILTETEVPASVEKSHEGEGTCNI